MILFFLFSPQSHVFVTEDRLKNLAAWCRLSRMLPLVDFQAPNTDEQKCR